MNKERLHRTVRTAVLGVGHLGQHHARICAQSDYCQLVGIVDTDAVRAAEIAQKHDTTVISDYRELVGKVDAVSIATPTDTHYELASFFLSRGVHVLVEKPIAASVEQGEALVALARQKGLNLQVGHLERFNAAVVTARSFIERPGFIETQRLGSFSPRSLDIDVVLDLMIHDIDIVLSFVKSPLRSIQAVGVPVLTPKIDIANARLTFESGCVVNLTASRASLEQTRKIRVFQKNLYLSLDYAAQKLFYCRLEKPDPLKKDDAAVQVGLPGFPMIKKVDVEVTPQEPLKAEIESFLQSVIKGERPEVPGEEGLAALRIAHQVVRVMEEGSFSG